MPEYGWRQGVRWVLGLLLLLYLAAGLTDPQEPDPHPDDAVDAVPAGEVGQIRITRARPSEVAPGGTVVLELTEKASRGGATLNGRRLEAVVAEGRELVFKIPEDAAEGEAQVRVQSGTRESGARVLEIKTPRRRKSLRNTLGGLALVVLGIWTFARGVRRRVGAGWRERLARLSSHTSHGVAWGILAGSLTQTGPTVAALAVSGLGSRLLGLGAAVAIMIGAQLGASVVGALLPLAASREALMIVALGVAWLSMARDRRGRGAGELVLGAGLLFHGLYLLRVGLGPLMEAPQIVGWLSQIDASTWGGLFLCGAIGAALCAVVQGPGPAFFVVLGLAQSTSLLGLDEAVAISAGTMLGTGLAAAAVAWPYGGDARRFGSASLALAGLGSLVVLVTLPVWISLASAVAGTDPDLTVYGKKMLRPQIGVHLTIAFISSQLAGALVAALAIRALPLDVPKRSSARAGRLTVGEVQALFPSYAQVLESCHRLSVGGDRADAARAERGLAALESERQRFSDIESNLGELLVGVGHLHRTCRELLRAADRSVEIGIRMQSEDLVILDRLGKELRTGLTDLAALERDLDLEQARAREIRMNAAEADFRRSAATRGPGAIETSALVGAYEAVGNQIFRLFQILADDD